MSPEVQETQRLEEVNQLGSETCECCALHESSFSFYFSDVF
jgi:hypothetical protein